MVKCVPWLNSFGFFDEMEEGSSSSMKPAS